MKFMELRKAKYKILQLGWGNPKDKHRLGGEWIRASIGQKDLWTFVDENLNVAQQCALTAQKGNCILGCINSSVASRARREEILPFSSTPVNPTWSAVFSSGASSTRKVLNCWNEPRGGH